MAQLGIPQKQDHDAPKGQNFDFFPLEGESPIRLLYLLRGVSDQSCSSYALKSVDLSQKSRPSYSCLSYTWSNPCWEQMNNVFEVADRSEDYGADPGGRNNKITCNGRSLYVTDNLHAALARLENDVAFIDEEDSTGRLPIWIDAICIHQEFTNERNSQVAKMDKIYRDAQKVIIWLGPENKTYTSMAIDVLDRLSAVPEEKRGIKLPDGLDDPEIYKVLGINHIFIWEWTALGELFRRKWFNRIWVIQESFEARDLIIYCGKHILSWKQIVKVSELLRESGLDRALMDYLYNAFPSQPNQQDEEEYAIEESDDQMESPDEVDGDIYVGNIVSNQRLFEDLKEQKGTLKLERLLSYARYFGATNRSDYVYAVRGMWKPLYPHKNLLDTIKPDYNIPIEEVFTSAAFACMVETGDLNILSLVEDHSLRIQREREEHAALRKELKGEKDPTQRERKEREKQKEMLLMKLPSWVPDWSITPIAETMRITDSRQWTASKDLMECVPTPELVEKDLHVKGVYVATIDEKAVQDPEFMDEIGVEIFALLKFLSSLLEKYPSMSSALIEAFWKTIIKNTYDGKPENDEARKALKSFLAERLFQIQEKLNDLNSDDLDEDSPSTSFEPKSPSIDASDAQLPSSAESQLTQIENILNKLSARDETDTIPTYETILQIIDTEKSNTEFTGVNKESALFMESFRLAYIGRRLFGTVKNEWNGIMLGLGPKSLRKADEVWVIAGADVPMVLRRESEGKWQLVGECYCHGIMKGEAVRDAVQDVVLV